MYKAAYQKHTLSIFMYNTFLLRFDVLYYFNICVTEASSILNMGYFYNRGHNISAIFNNLAQVQIATSKTIFDI